MQTAKCLGDMENYSIYMLNGKMGLAGTPNGEKEQVILTQPKYSVIYPFVKGHAIVKVGDYYGVINKYGVETIPANRYKHINPNWEKGYFFVSDNHFGDEHYLDAENNPFPIDEKRTDYSEIKRKVALIGHLNYDEIRYFGWDNTIFHFEYDDYEYLYNDISEKIIFIGDDLKVLNGNIYIGRDKNTRKYGGLDKGGRTVIPFIYDDLWGAGEQDNEYYDLIEAERNGKSGYINTHGETIIPFTYLRCGRFSNGYAWVTNDAEKVGLINKNGTIIEPLIHDNIIELSDGRNVYIDSGYKESYTVQNMPKQNINQDWKHKHFSFDIFHNPNFVGVETADRKRGVTYLDGRVILPAVYDDITFWQSIYNNGVIVKKNNKYGVVDLQNNILIPFEYDGIGVIENINRNGKNCSYYGVRRNGLSGVIDNNFRECIPIMYSRLEYSKSYNCFVVEVKGDKAMIDINNNIVVPFTSNRLDKHDFY